MTASSFQQNPALEPECVELSEQELAQVAGGADSTSILREPPIIFVGPPVQDPYCPWQHHIPVDPPIHPKGIMTPA